MEIRTERPMDAEAIRLITLAAFKNARHSNQHEADIVDALRAAGALTVSLVAVQDDEVVGHVAYSPANAQIRNGEGEEVVYITPRSTLPDEDPRSEPTRSTRRRVMRGVYSKPLKLPSMP